MDMIAMTNDDALGERDPSWPHRCEKIYTHGAILLGRLVGSVRGLLADLERDPLLHQLAHRRALELAPA